MQIMLTLPDTLVSRLIAQAESINLTFNEFLLNALQNKLLVTQKTQELNGNSDLDSVMTADNITGLKFYENDTVADVVKRIQSRPPNPANIRVPTKTIDEVMEDIEKNPPEERYYTPAEWDQMWAEFEHGLKMADTQNDIDHDFNAVANLAQENWLTD